MVLHSPYPDFEVPSQDLWEFLFENPKRQFPDSHVILHDPATGQDLTWLQLKQSTEELGRALTQYWGWKTGETLAYLSLNHLDAPCVIGGVHWAGGVFTGINYTNDLDTICSQLKETKAKALIFHPDLYQVAVDAAENAAIPRRRLAVVGSQNYRGILCWKSLCSHLTQSGERKVKLSPSSDPAYICYSSGTTGKGKGIVLSHFSAIAGFLQLRPGEDNTNRWDRDVVAAIGPVYTSFGLLLVYHYPAWAGVKSLFSAENFSFYKLVTYIEKYKITEVFATPALASLFISSPFAANVEKLSSMTCIVSSGAPLMPDVARVLAEKFNIPIRQGYGLTEMTNSVTLVGYTDWIESIGSVGKLLANIEARIVDKNGQDVPEGMQGELWIKGPSMMLRYTHQTAEDFQSMLSVDGFLKTGDIMYVKNGFFYHSGREAECIFCEAECIFCEDGTIVSPVVLEEILLEHPFIKDVAVIRTIVDGKQQPKACIIPSTAAAGAQIFAGAFQDVLGQELNDFIKDKVPAGHSLNGGIAIVDRIPKHLLSGKIQRLQLQAEYGNVIQ